MDPSRAVLWLSSSFVVALCHVPVAQGTTGLSLQLHWAPGDSEWHLPGGVGLIGASGCLCWNELPGHKMCFPRAAPLPPASPWSTEPPLPPGNAAVVDP